MTNKINGLLPTSSPIGMQQTCIHDLQERHWTHGWFSMSLGKYSCKQMLQMSSSLLITAEEVLSVHCCCRHCLPLALGVWLLFVTFSVFIVLSLLAFLFAFCFFWFSSLSNSFWTFSSSIDRLQIWRLIYESEASVYQSVVTFAMGQFVSGFLCSCK